MEPSSKTCEFNLKVSKLKAYWDAVVKEMQKGQRVDFEESLKELSSPGQSEYLIRLWMRVFTLSMTEPLLDDASKLELADWILNKVPWLNQSLAHFVCVDALEQFVLAVGATDKLYIDTYLRILASRLVPARLGIQDPSAPAVQSSFFVAGLQFANEKELISYVQDSIISKYCPLVKKKPQNLHASPLSGVKSAAEDRVEIDGLDDKLFLQELFQNHPNIKKSDNITKIFYGPSLENGGASYCFQIRKYLEPEPLPVVETDPRIAPKPELLESVTTPPKILPSPIFARPAPCVMISEDISYIKCSNNIYSKLVYKKQQIASIEDNKIFVERILQLLKKMITIFPLYLAKLCNIIVSSIPHHRASKLQLVGHSQNLLFIAQRMPRLEIAIVKQIMSKILKIDAEASSIDLQNKADDMIQLVLLYSAVKLGAEVDKSQLDPFFRNFYNELLANSKGHVQKRGEKYVEELIKFFALKVMKVERPRYIQFVYYYLCSMGQSYAWIKESFLEMLILNIVDTHLQRQIKMNSLYYLFSFISCSNFNTEIILYTSLDFLLTACSQTYSSFLKRNKLLKNLLEQNISVEEFSLMLTNRRNETEETNIINDDIFIYCLQSLLYLMIEYYGQLDSSQKERLMTSFDNFFQDKKTFVMISNAESDIFEEMYQRLVLIVPSEHSGSVKMINRCIDDSFDASLTGKNAHNQKVKAIDYFPFEPIEASFFDIFISKLIDWGHSASSFFSDKEMVLSNFSQLDTSIGTTSHLNVNLNPVSSGHAGTFTPTLGKRSKCGSLTPPSCNKYLKLQQKFKINQLPLFQQL